MVLHRLAGTATVVVTGASSGIGEASALRLDRLGFRVFAGVRREEDGAALQRRASGQLTPLFLDVTNTSSIAASVDTVAAAVGETGLAGLVNNAGIAVAGPLEFLPVAEIRRQLEVNVIGQIAVTQAFLPLLRPGQGRIVNVGSLAGRIALPFLGPYNVSKFALEAFTDSLRLELRPWGIRVSIIEPGFIATPIWGKSMAATDDIFKNLPQRASDLYRPLLSTAHKFATNASKNGTSVDEVAKTIVQALTVARPKTRYIVGRGSRLGTAVLEHLPDSLRDLLITWWLS
jgi:NAD(P)-dependent dehydrogenase (short-subunit alcohol dehydrogenase family)